MAYPAKQLTSKATVPYGRWNEETSAREVAEVVARKCHGCFDWNGCQSIYAPSGLSRMGDAWLKKNASDPNARLDEFPLSDGTSKYSPYWEQPKRRNS